MGLMVPDKSGNTSSSDSLEQLSDTDDYKQLESTINPVTGRAEPEPATDPFEGMSEEQKEYEAMRLVKDLDRLAKIGGVLRPARIGSDGRPVAIEHVLELQDTVKIPNEKVNKKDETD